MALNEMARLDAALDRAERASRLLADRHRTLAEAARDSIEALDRLIGPGDADG